MSRHRSAVIVAVERLSQAASASLSAQVLEPLRKRGINQFLLDLFPDIHTATELSREYVKQFSLDFAQVSIPDLLKIDVHVAVRFAERDAICIIADGPTNRRRMVVADTTVKARIKTRWVHIWREQEKRIEWPCESC
jgi:hypothetical protein